VPLVTTVLFFIVQSHKKFIITFPLFFVFLKPSLQVTGQAPSLQTASEIETANTDDSESSNHSSATLLEPNQHYHNTTKQYETNKIYWSSAVTHFVSVRDTSFPLKSTFTKTLYRLTSLRLCCSNLWQQHITTTVIMPNELLRLLSM